MKEELFNDQNSDIKLNCKYCQQSINDNSIDLFYDYSTNNIIKYFHEECYNKNNIRDVINFFNFKKLNINDGKYHLYKIHKMNIMNKLKIIIF